MNAATIKLFLPLGDPKRLRTAEISNWSGKAVAAPRTDLDQFLQREEVLKPGVYVLTGDNPNTGNPQCYIGEAEVIRDRVKQHKNKDFWVQIMAFVSKDENLTKGHIRYLEGRLIYEAKVAGRFKVSNAQQSGAMLPESDREDMEVFLEKIKQLFPVLGYDIVRSISEAVDPASPGALITEIKGITTYGQRTTDGFVVLKDSHAVKQLRPSAAQRAPFVVKKREQFIADGTLVEEGDSYRFTKNAEFATPSGAAAVIHGGSANGLTSWKTSEGVTLKQLEA